jgi:hypothetical protein
LVHAIVQILLAHNFNEFKNDGNIQKNSKIPFKYWLITKIPTIHPKTYNMNRMPFFAIFSSLMNSIISGSNAALLPEAIDGFVEHIIVTSLPNDRRMAADSKMLKSSNNEFWQKNSVFPGLFSNVNKSALNENDAIK